MLVELNIKNFALIQELSVEFGAGFNILSGETGAGKSILIDTIDYVLGGKFSKDQIRYGEDKTIVEAVFSIENDEVYEVLDELSIDRDEMLIIRRKINEEEDLKDEFNMLSNAEKISNSLVKSYGYLNSSNDGISVLEGLSKVISELSLVENVSEVIKEKKNQIEEAFYNLEEVTREIRDIGSEITYDEDRLAQINERIYSIGIYKKKYGNSIREILENLKNLKEKYNELVNSEEIINKLKEEQRKLEEKMKVIGEKLHNLRVEASEILEVNIKKELSYVGLEKAIIKIEVLLTENMNSRGYDEVQFLVSANPGEPLKPLEKVLSGGELSRIMLALKCVFVDKDKIPTLIFDEIDTGISGTIGKRVGEKMYEVSIKHQVLCITHLPQIAALSDNHYFVSKEVLNGKTFTGIRMLNRDDKIREIAKMVGGDEISDVTIENASEMVKFAEIKKKEMKNN